MLVISRIFILLIIIFYPLSTFSKQKNKNQLDINKMDFNLDSKNRSVSTNVWEKIDTEKFKNKKKIEWQFMKPQETLHLEEKVKTLKEQNKKKKVNLTSLNRSIVFNNRKVGPDISWIVPPGLKWNKRYKFDFTARGHNTQIPEPAKKNFFGWNDGDAVGLISYQFLHKEKTSFGLNFGIRSLYEGYKAAGGGTAVGDGLSSGFRWDYALSDNSGLAIGAEQLIHYDGTTDTGRNIYLTLSKAWWSSEFNGYGQFPLYIATAGLGTGRMAVGTIKGMCSDILGGSGTEVGYKRSLCWAPVFSIAKVWNENLSTYFEYNSRFFIAGSSIAPIKNIPLRGNFAIILSDHVDNYKVHSFSEMNWVFNLSLGF